MLIDSFWNRRRMKRRAKEIVKITESWPLSRCVDVLPYAGLAGNHTFGNTIRR